MPNIRKRDVALHWPVASEADIACLQCRAFHLGLGSCQTEPLPPVPPWWRNWTKPGWPNREEP